MFKFPPQFGDTVYYITGNKSLTGEEYIHDGRKYFQSHIEYPTHQFVPLLVISSAGDNVLTEKGLTEIYNGNVVLTIGPVRIKDEDIYCHWYIVDQFYIDDWEAHYHNINVGEGDEYSDWIA